MGSVMRRAVTNIYEIPEDLIVEAIGRGFSIVRGGDPPCLLEVDAGLGLFLHDQTGGKVSVDAGDGLGFDGNKLAVKLGVGLTMDEDRKVSIDVNGGLCCCDDGHLNVKTGSGLTIDKDKSVAVNVGPGLTVGTDNKLSLVLDAEPAHSIAFDSVKDVTFAQNGAKLVVTKTLVTRTAKRNASGVLLDLVESNERVVRDEFILTDSTYGYGGYGQGYLKSLRSGSDSLPNFYKQ